MVSLDKLLPFWDGQARPKIGPSACMPHGKGIAPDRLASSQSPSKGSGARSLSASSLSSSPPRPTIVSLIFLLLSYVYL